MSAIDLLGQYLNTIRLALPDVDGPMNQAKAWHEKTDRKYCRKQEPKNGGRFVEAILYGTK